MRYLDSLISVLLSFAAAVTAHADEWEQRMTAGGGLVWRGIWTGSEMIRADLFGGMVHRYDPQANTLTSTAAANSPEARWTFSTVWTGREMIIWGGFLDSPPQDYLNTGHRFDPVTNTWTPLSTLNAPEVRAYHPAVWTGSEMIVWGGQKPESNAAPLNSGGRYNPETDTWLPVSSIGAPQARQGHSAIWTGSEMVIWGGGSYSGPQGNYRTGGRYDPQTDSWRPTSLTGAPSARRYQTAVWTGKEIIIWGGYQGGWKSSVPDDFARYDPAADRWTSGNTTGAPVGRTDHSGIWTGREMIVWGGWRAEPGPRLYFNTGGRYDPITDRWVATTITNAPSPRGSHSAVWTGREMLVIGGGAIGPLPDDIHAYTLDSFPQKEAFRITSVVLGNANLLISFPSQTGRNYTLWQSDTMSAGTWTDTGLPSLTGTGDTLPFTVPAPTPGRRFFRVQEGP